MPDDWITTERIWLAVGFVGQSFFFMRFVVQWVATEKARKSVIPDAFWWLSIFGSLVMLSYAIYRGDPVFILAFTPNVFIYSRNLYFIKKEREEEAASKSAEPQEVKAS